MATTRKKVKVIGTETFINQQTGEICEMNVLNIEERDANFHKIWLGHVIQALDVIGNQKIKVLTFVLDNLNKENQLIMTQRKIAEKSEVSYATVAETIKALQDSNFLVKINSGAYQVNPDVLFKGSKNNRLNILLQYNNAVKEAAATKSQEEILEEEGQTTILQAINESTATTSEPQKETCKTCGAELVERTRHQDGKKFLGCPNWRDEDHKVRKHA